MTRKRDRFFALFGAVLFLVTASAFTIAVVVNGISNHNKTDSSKTNADKITTCDSKGITATALPLPELYKPSGTVSKLETTDLEKGSGTAIKAGDCLQVKYYGTLAKDGTVFDENYDKPSGFQFKIGASQVITGWDQGLIGAQVGTTRRLVIPAAQAYGSSGQGTIPANADLVFIVKVLAVN